MYTEELTKHHIADFMKIEGLKEILKMITWGGNEFGKIWGIWGISAGNENKLC